MVNGRAEELKKELAELRGERTEVSERPGPQDTFFSFSFLFDE